MTREQKIEWLTNASDEQVVEQMRWAVLGTMAENMAIRIDGEEDYKLVKAELMKRLARQ